MTFIGYRDWSHLAADCALAEPRPAGLMLAAGIPETAGSSRFPQVLLVWCEGDDDYRMLLEATRERVLVMPGTTVLGTGPDAMRPASITLVQARRYTAEDMLLRLVQFGLPERLAALGLPRTGIRRLADATPPALCEAMLALAREMAAGRGISIQYVVTCATGRYDSYHKAYGATYPTLELAASHVRAAIQHEDDQEANPEDYEGPASWGIEAILLNRMLPAHLRPYASGEKRPPARPVLEPGSMYDVWRVVVPGRGEVAFHGLGAEAMAAIFFTGLPFAKVRVETELEARRGLDYPVRVAINDPGRTAQWIRLDEFAGTGEILAIGPDAAGLLAAIEPAIAAARQRWASGILADQEAVAAAATGAVDCGGHDQLNFPVIGILG